MKSAASPLYLRDEELNQGVELFFVAQRDFMRMIDPHLARSGLGRAHFRALYFIARRPNLPVMELIAALGITKQSLNRVLKLLLARGYVTLSAASRDRRQRLLSLTEGGLALAEQFSITQRSRLAKAYRDAGPDAVSGFRKVLSGLLSERERGTIQGGGSQL